jgi:hypothetical protein
LPYCPNCGTEVDEDKKFCPECGNNLEEEEPQYMGADEDAVGHLTRAFNISMDKPMVFIPTLLGGVISAIIGWIASSLGYSSGGMDFGGFATLSVLFSLAGGFFVYILSFASIDMGRDAYLNKPLSLGESIGYVLKRLVTFILASIVGVILSITIILIPVVSLMFVIMVIDETGISSSLSRAFSLVGAELRDIVVIILLSIIGTAIISFIPIISGLLQSALTVVVNLAFIDMYYRYKRR